MFSLQKGKLFGVAVRRVFNNEFNLAKFHRTAVDMQYSNHRCASKETWKLSDFLRTGKGNEVSTIWLRENCRCRECYNIETQQRNVHFYKLDPNSFHVESFKEAGEGETVEVLWSDNHISCYDKEWLRSKINDERPQFESSRFAWDSNSIRSYVDGKKVDYESLMHDEASLKTACEDLYKYGLVQIEGVPTNVEDTRKAAERISSIKETFYGRMFEVNVTDEQDKVDIDVKDSAYSNIVLGLHTDGNYFSEPPAILALHFLRPAEDGGESIFADGFHAAELLKHQDAQAYHILATHLVNFSYKDERRYLNQTCPTFEMDYTTGDLRRVRYNHYDRSARYVCSPSIPSSTFYEAFSHFSNIVDDPANSVSCRLQPGTLLLIDNWRVFHGRRSFKGSRKFVGCYMDRDKWLSNLSVL